MTFVDAHQPAFAGHGVCARAETDPEFDRDCFSPDGTSFRAERERRRAARRSTCPHRAERISRLCAARALDPHRQRQLFRRDDLSAGRVRLRCSRATFTTRRGACLSAVYGGAVHPTAEGHAAMADAAVVAARRVLTLPGPQPGIARSAAAAAGESERRSFSCWNFQTDLFRGARRSARTPSIPTARTQTTGARPAAGSARYLP